MKYTQYNKTLLSGLAFVIGLFLVLISPCFLTEGMFMDGLIYSCLSRNLHDNVGIASFWNPFFSETFFPKFREHPPLAFGIQSIFYNFGDSFYIEKIYSVLTFAVTGFVMIKIWKKLTNNVSFSWIPLVFWITIPLVFWSATNNMLENTMQIFTILCLYFCIKSYKNNQYYLLLIAGFFLFLAFLTKGFTGLYLLCFPFFYWLFFKNGNAKTMFINTLFMLIGLIVPLIILLLCSEVACLYFSEYLDNQVARSINHVQTVDNRFFIILRFIKEILISLTISVVIFMMSKNKTTKLKNNKYFKWFLLLLSITLSGILPIMISMKQSGFYILTVFPIYSIALGLIIFDSIENIQIGKKIKNIFTYFSIIILCIGIASNVYFCGEIGRDKVLLKDIHTILPYLEKGEIVSISNNLHYNYSLHGYMARIKNISLDSKNNNKFFISDTKIDDDNYKIVTTETEEIFLYTFNPS